MSRYRESSSDMGWGGFAICIVLIIVCFFVMDINNESSIESSRKEQHMILIEDGFTYDWDTLIIYRESIRGASKYSCDTTSYTPYYNENGNMCKYVNGEYVEFNSYQYNIGGE